MDLSLVYDLLIILTAGLLSGLVCKRLRVPTLIGYMLVGVLIGNGGLQLIRERSHDIESLAETGVFLLLFAIGLEFSLDELWKLGRHLLVGGSIQMGLVIAPVSFLLNLLGYSWQTSLLLASAFAFSSTVLVFKTLSDWGRSSSAPGRRAIGILLFQDAALIPLLLVIPLLSGENDQIKSAQVIQLFLTSFLFVGSVIFMRWLLSRWVIPTLASLRSPDSVVLASVVLLGGVTMAAFQFGLPPAVGAFAAGLMLSGTRWTAQIDALVLPFRETFAVVFFVSLGMLLDPKTVFGQPVVFVTSLIVLIALKTIAATIALRLTALSWKSSFHMSLGLAHVGEFAFGLVTIAFQAGLVTAPQAQQFVGLSLLSLMISPLLLSRAIKQTDAPSQATETRRENLAIKSRSALVVGLGPIGRQLASQLETAGYDVCLIDRSPLNLQQFAQQGFRTIVGDASESDVLERAEIRHTGIAIISIAIDTDALSIVRQLRRLNRDGEIFVRCRFQSNVRLFKKLGASFVVSEETQALDALSKLLREVTPNHKDS